MNGVFGFDIQYTICTEGNLDRRDFCRLALTSRSWKEAATPNIWVQPDAITPLLRLMPQDAWYWARNRPNDPKAYFVLRRPLTPADWEPVYARSRFVKDMRVHDTELEDLHELCTFIAPCPPPRVLLPRLETLEAYTTKRQSQFSADQSLLPLFSILLSPSPYLLHFQDMGSKIVRHLNMLSLASLCPHITWIEVKTWAELTPTLLSQWAEAIKKWDGMTSISLDPCFPEILLSIAPGPALSYLSLHFRHVKASEATNRMPTLPSSCLRIGTGKP